MARIIVMDDDPQVASLLQRILQHAGHTVRMATEGGAGIRMYRQEPADLVITDLFMPGQDGIETILQLQTEFPGVRTLVISGAAPAGPHNPLQDAELLGASRSLAKPFLPKDLLRAVDEILEVPAP